MKTIKYLAVTLMLLPMASFASGKLECGKWRETDGMGEERRCTYQGSSLNDAVLAYFKDSTIPYRRLMLKNHRGQTVVDMGEEGLRKFIYHTKWESPTKVTVSGCVEETDACDFATFESKGNIIRIYGYGS